MSSRDPLDRTPPRVAERPRPDMWNDDETLTLEEAATLFWPRGPLSTKSLRTAARRGQLAVVVIARKILTTPGAVRAMTRPVAATPACVAAAPEPAGGAPAARPKRRADAIADAQQALLERLSSARRSA